MAVIEQTEALGFDPDQSFISVPSLTDVEASGVVTLGQIRDAGTPDPEPEPEPTPEPDPEPEPEPAPEG